MARSKFEVREDKAIMPTVGMLQEQIAPMLAKYARSELAIRIANKEASPNYEKYINGRKGAEEETVVAPGPILYVFSYWEPVIKAALAFLEKRSPVKSGRYRSTHMVMIGGQPIRPDTEISPDEEVTIVNTQPYSRKIEVGHMRMEVERGVYQDCRKFILQQFGGAKGAFDVSFKQIILPNGYILKGRFRKGFREFARKGLKKDTMAGARMTYPALILKMK